jgi:hypothetical protein
LSTLLIVDPDEGSLDDCFDWLTDRKIPLDENERFGCTVATFGPGQDSDAVEFKIRFGAVPVRTALEEEIDLLKEAVNQYPELKTEAYHRLIIELKAELALVHRCESDTVCL